MYIYIDREIGQVTYLWSLYQLQITSTYARSGPQVHKPRSVYEKDLAHQSS